MTQTAIRSAAIRSLDEGSRSIRVVASTNEVDRYDSIIRQHWDLENFDRNPVSLWMHSHYQPPIGRVSDWETDGEFSRSEATITFAETDFGEEIWQLYRQGILKAVSVGFMPGERGMADLDGAMVETMGSPEAPNELYELSAVTVPGNASALVTNSLADDMARLDSLTNSVQAMLTELELQKSHQVEFNERAQALLQKLESHGVPMDVFKINTL